MKIFAGSSNPTLAEKIAKERNIPLGKIELSRFANGECRVWVKDKVANHKVIVLQSFSFPPDEHFVEFCLIVDALNHLGAKKIIVVIPWLGYCVQDKVFREGEPFSAKVVAKLVQSLNVDQIITLDLHNETIVGFFDLPFTHLSAASVFIDYFAQKKATLDAIVSPDVGSLKRARKFAQDLDLPLTVINKKRDLATGKVSVLGVNGSIKGKKVLIVDDFISTGGTLVKTARFLKRRGVSKVYAAVTHHFYVKGVQQKLEKSQLDRLFVTDTIQAPKNLVGKKLTIISVDKLLAEVLKNC